MWPKVFRNHAFSRRISDMALSQVQEVNGVVAKGCNVKLIFGKIVSLNSNVKLKPHFTDFYFG